MKQIIECVPNFSEGRDKKKIKQITDEIEKIKGVKLLNVEPDKDHNRCVVTFVGDDPNSVLEAAYSAIAKAAKVIDMSKHKGEHKRMGATDVCPFVPVIDTTIEECIELANKLGERVGKELNIPVYLYAEAAKTPQRKRLPNIREGQYEGLEEKLKREEWKPDYGEAKFNKKSGATAVGARMFLIAYNVNLATDDVNIAKAISLAIREIGELIRDKEGRILIDKNGKKLRLYGKFKDVQAGGMHLKEHNCAQVSMNLLNYKEVSMYNVFDEIKVLAERYGTEVKGSEIVGLVPKDALINTDLYNHLDREHKRPVEDYTADRLIESAVEVLGLDQLYEFKPEEKIIEYMLKC